MGPFIYYVITFLGFLDPPPPLRQRVFSTKNKQKLAFGGHPVKSTLFFFSGWQKCLIFFRVATSWCRLNMWLAINSAALEFCQMELKTMLVFKGEDLGLRFTYNDMKTILSNGHRVYMNSQVSEVYCM